VFRVKRFGHYGCRSPGDSLSNELMTIGMNAFDGNKKTVFGDFSGVECHQGNVDIRFSGDGRCRKRSQ